MTYGLNHAAEAEPPAALREIGPVAFEAFRAALDTALDELAQSRGERYLEAEKTYNELWPDGLTVCIGREPRGGFKAHFSTGEVLTFKDHDDLGAALLLMRDKELFELLCVERAGCFNGGGEG